MEQILWHCRWRKGQISTTEHKSKQPTFQNVDIMTNKMNEKVSALKTSDLLGAIDDFKNDAEGLRPELRAEKIASVNNYVKHTSNTSDRN